jgi:hypothetical protein
MTPDETLWITDAETHPAHWRAGMISDSDIVTLKDAAQP